MKHMYMYKPKNFMWLYVYGHVSLKYLIFWRKRKVSTERSGISVDTFLSLQKIKYCIPTYIEHYMSLNI